MLPCSFRSADVSSMVNFMMRLMIVSTSCGSCSSGGTEHDRHSGRALTFNKKSASSISYVVDMTEDILAD